MTKSTFPARGTVLALLCLITSFAASAASRQPSCGALCGRWRLDTAASDPVEAYVATALAAYRESRPTRAAGNGNITPRNLQAAAEAELRESLGPITERPNRSNLRSELLAMLTPPQTLQITVAGPDVLIGADDRSARHYSPGVPHARVDAQGTAKIKATLAPGRFTLQERYDRSRQYLETYTVQRTDGSLLVERQIDRPGLKTLRLRAVYRPE